MSMIGASRCLARWDSSPASPFGIRDVRRPSQLTVRAGERPVVGGGRFEPCQKLGMLIRQLRCRRGPWSAVAAGVVCGDPAIELQKTASRGVDPLAQPLELGAQLRFARGGSR